MFEKGRRRDKICYLFLLKIFVRVFLRFFIFIFLLISILLLHNLKIKLKFLFFYNTLMMIFFMEFLLLILLKRNFMKFSLSNPTYVEELFA